MRLSSEEKYNPDTLVLSHSTLKSVMQANSEEIVLQKIKMSFPKYKYVVVWTKDTYELFKRGMDTYGYIQCRDIELLYFEKFLCILQRLLLELWLHYWWSEEQQYLE